MTAAPRHSQPTPPQLDERPEATAYQLQGEDELELPAESKVSFTFDRLAPATSRQEFETHQAALEWSLADPIIIESAEDVKSKTSWQQLVQPFRHQMQNLMTFCRRLPVSLIADDVGLGKTISAGLILSELMVRRRVSRALVLCKSALGPQWVEELESKFGIEARFAVGTAVDKELRGTTPVVATTYESGNARLDRLTPGAFDFLILDEAHHLRNLYGTEKPPAFAQRVRGALERRLFKYVLMLTATPIQNRVWDIYSLVDCLSVAKGHANPFGTPQRFRQRFVADQSGRELVPHAAEEFRGILRQYLVRTRRQDARLLFPDREVRMFPVPPAPIDHRIQTLMANVIARLSAFEQSSLLVAMMSSPEALVSQLRNMAARRPVLGPIAEEIAAIRASGAVPAKLGGLRHLIDELRTNRPADWRLVVYTVRTETQKAIGRLLHDLEIPFGFIEGGAATRNYRAIKDYTAQPPRIHVIVSTDAGAEGINLQAGNVLVNYDLPWNPMVVEQRIGRIQRLASKHGSVVVLNLAVADSPEHRVVVRLMEKLQTIAATVGDIEAILESTTRRDDVAVSFQSSIRELVVQSLTGQDAVRATRLAEESIENAKKLYEEKRGEMDATLGRLDELHQTGPRMPKLTRRSPSLPLDRFVCQACELEGASLAPHSDSGVLVHFPHQSAEHYTFDEEYWRQHNDRGVFQGRVPKLFLPGKPPFERLVQRWLDRGSSYVVTTDKVAGERTKDEIERWVQRIPGASLVRYEVTEERRQFDGHTTLQVTVANGIDSYENLVEVNHGTLPDDVRMQVTGTNAAVLNVPLDPVKAHPEIEHECQQASDSDPDLQAFKDFYKARLREDLTRAGKEAARRKKVEDDLLPRVYARVVSMEGIQHAIVQVAVHVAIDTVAGYSAVLELSPLLGKVLREPAFGTCQKSNRSAPQEFLEICAFTGHRALRHYLETSDYSGRRALREHIRTCERTGKRAIEDEFSSSNVSGKSAIATAFEISPINNRRGFPEEFTTCAFTGTRVLTDEVATSDISGKTYRIDEQAVSPYSGRQGHKSEFVQCTASGHWVPEDETVKSHVSGAIMHRQLAVTSQKSLSRLGTPQEAVVCAISGRTLLVDGV